MRDPFQPTTDEIRAWAYDADSLCPEEDWDLIISGRGHDELFWTLASDSQCPKRHFFLECLALNLPPDATDPSELEPFYSRAEKSCDPVLEEWAASWKRTIQHRRRAIERR